MDRPLIPFSRPMNLPSGDRKELVETFKQIVDSGILTNGQHVRKFEEAIGSQYPAKHVLACSSGTTALWIALEALRRTYFPSTADVVYTVEVQAFTWSSVIHVAQPLILTDIHADTWLMKPQYIGTVMIATHTFGNTCRVDRTTDQFNVAYRRFGLLGVPKLIYDAAESFGASIQDFGDATFFSFSPTKTITSMEGGAILSNDLQLYNEMLHLRNSCGRMSEIHAAVGSKYLTYLPEIIARKQTIFNYYREQLPFVFQKVVTDHACGIIGALTDKDPDTLTAKLSEKGVETRRYYRPLSQKLSVTNDVYRKILCLPCYPGIDERKVVEIVQSCLED